MLTAQQLVDAGFKTKSNGNKKDNRIENLLLFSSPSEHTKHHWEERMNIL